MLDGIRTKALTLCNKHERLNCHRCGFGQAEPVCYCAIGAGGKPCVDRAYCSEHGDRKFAEASEARWRKNGAFVDKPDPGHCRFNCRTARESWLAGHAAGLNLPSELTGKYTDAEQEAYREWERRQAKTD